VVKGFLQKILCKSFNKTLGVNKLIRYPLHIYIFRILLN
jgi:hypothetical protein